MRIVKVSQTEISAKSAFTFKLRKKLMQETERVYIGKARNSSRGAVEKAHNGVQKAVGQKLTDGFPNPSVGGVQTVTYRGPFGARSFRTPNWSPLTPRYAKSSPVSKVFWRKHFASDVYKHGDTLRPTLRAMYEISKRATHAKTDKPFIVETQKGRRSRGAFKASWTITFNTPTLILQEALTLPMLKGAGSKAGDVFGASQGDSDVGRWFSGTGWTRGSPPGLNVLVWNEALRPFVRNLSFDVGRQLRLEIRDRFNRLATKK